ncbi:methyltransferase [Mycobacterium sp. 1165178.9]|uniref:methyltransferase n=1 Tax=Mycobacterium sp. 1165178.9 TaxID=1834070 RepID=UPI000A782596|nr:methyltransferase [Mycobacterium sp. 1165178.9]
MSISETTPLDQQAASAAKAMQGLILGAWVAQTITAVADLGVADALADRPLQLDELASRVGADSDALHRVLRALICKGIFAQGDDGRYQLTPRADVLRSDAPISMAALARLVGAPQEREHWSLLTQTIRTGTSPVQELRGKRFFDYLRDEPEYSAIFNDAMTGLSAYVDGPLVKAYDFTPFATIVDVAGGHGRLLAAILASAPNTQGVLFDLPGVVAEAAPLLRKLDVAQRVRLVAGSFFSDVPSGADAYVLKHIVHDWSDDAALRILQNVRRAAPTGAALLLVETVIPQDNSEFTGKIADIEMLLFNDGRERTAKEYQRLLEKAGFEMTHIFDTETDFSVIEARAR